MTGRQWFHFETISQTSETALRTSEVARDWTEHSPKSKLNQIKSKLNSARSNEARELKNLINRREYRQFQKKIWITSFSQLDWKLWSRSFDYFNSYLQKVESARGVTDNISWELRNFRDRIQTPGSTRDTTGNTGESRDFVDYVHRPEYQQLTDSARIHRASREYLSKHESMSENEYNRIFSWKEQLGQWQLGNCYLVSGFIELANTQYFDTLMRTSISRVQFKDDWAFWYNIRIPLWEPDGRDILIKDSELRMSSIRWNIGYKILELAYVKNKRRNNRDWNRYAPVSQREMQWITWWTTHEVLQTFLGRHNIWFSDFWTGRLWTSWQTLSALSQRKKNEITNYLRNFNWRTWNTFTDLITAPSKWWDRNSFRVWWNTLYNQHAYALSSVDKNLNVYVKNPWNNQRKAWGTEIKLSLNEFFYAFSYIGIWKIKVNTFLDNRWDSYA